MLFNFTGGTFGGAANGWVSLIKPDGSTLTSSHACGTSCMFDTTTLPLSGIYKIVVDPQSTYTGNLTAQLYDVPADATTGVTPGGAPSTVTVGSPGQNGYWSFTGTAGQRVSFKFTGGTLGWTSAQALVYKPDGSQLTSNVYCGDSCWLDAVTLPVTGTYKILFDPFGTNTGSLTAQLYDVPADATTGLTIGGGARVWPPPPPGRTPPSPSPAAPGRS